MDFKIRLIREEEEEEVYGYWKDGILNDHKRESIQYFTKLLSVRSIFVITGFVIPFVCGCKLIGTLLSLFLYYVLVKISAKLGKDQIQIRDDMRSIIKSYPGRFFVVEDSTSANKEICAFIAIRPKFIDGSLFNEILSFSVCPGYRRRGLGRLLLKHVFSLSSCSDRGVYLSTTCMQEAALNLYRKMGFSETMVDWTDWVQVQTIISYFICKYILVLRIHQFILPLQKLRLHYSFD
ncbi:Oidioi.mRNA.OKI2018_I69.chr1.g3909.t1.cds [Oikopleura dioica]|uniref:Oidioi.mRNA.OKI2018_I69.chr1.g3909.t1.cds n=1 Tax=Oikopleura dioica TaxID=34765 RepID=A0ABN7SZI9_OIKDI|nr:Oidioi.mRNA.OKI2018_I69.chr1.g3909.t1.cds [Oikopleura dioica]